MPNKTAGLPLFDKFGVDELLERLPYSIWYLTDIRSGHRPPTEKFILTACGILNRTREELFGDQGD